MNRDRAKELLPIITAFANGEDIECYENMDVSWHPLGPKANWDDGVKYRIKPKPREFYAYQADDGIWRVHALNQLSSAPANPYIKVREVCE